MALTKYILLTSHYYFIENNVEIHRISIFTEKFGDMTFYPYCPALRTANTTDHEAQTQLCAVLGVKKTGSHFHDSDY